MPIDGLRLLHDTPHKGGHERQGTLMTQTTSPAAPYYTAQAYHPQHIPPQPDAPPRKQLYDWGGNRLPWGHTKDVLPDNLMKDPDPESMRFWEQVKNKKNEEQANGTYVPRPFEHVNLHYKHDHEMIRHAQLPAGSQFWLLLGPIGKWTAIILLPFLIFTHIAMLYNLSEPPWELTKKLFFEVHSWFLGIPLALFLLGRFVIAYCPSLWIRAPKGPLWELNRRTGMVKIFDYQHFKKTGVIGEDEAPFYEFDACIIEAANGHGPLRILALEHRYRKLSIWFNDLLCPDDQLAMPCALWDFLQNYMDTSRPLPDIPAHEEWRHLDPVTAEHDRRTGRPPRYWIDMDDKTFKARVKAMLGLIDGIEAFRRPNLMARHVNYAD